MTNLDSILKSRDIILPTNVHLVKAVVFPEVMYGCESWTIKLDYKESWAPKNGCFWTMMLEETLKSPLDCKEIQPVHSKGNQSWIFIGRTDAEAETPIFWPPDGKNQLNGKHPDAGKNWKREEKGWRRMRCLDSITDSMHMNLSKLRNWWWTGRPGMLWFMGSQRVGHDWVTDLNWSEPQVWNGVRTNTWTSKLSVPCLIQIFK